MVKTGLPLASKCFTQAANTTNSAFFLVMLINHTYILMVIYTAFLLHMLKLQVRVISAAS